MKIIIDRFEGDSATVELPGKVIINVPKILFPNAKEGDVISIEIDKEETKNRKKHINNLMNDLFKDWEYLRIKVFQWISWCNGQ